MSAFVGAVARRPDAGAPALARSLAEATRRRLGATARPLFEEGGVALWAIERHAGGEPFAGVLPDGARLFVSGSPDLPRDSIAATFAPCSTGVPPAPPMPDRRWIAAVVGASAGKIRLLGDRLGTSWLYFATTSDAVLFGPHYGALVASLSSTPRLDRETALVMLALAYAPDDRTCHEGVTILPPGTLVELDAGGIREIARAQPRFGDAEASRSDAEKDKRLDELLDAAAATWLPPGDEGLLLSLSGGNDSKYGALLLARRGRRAHAVTFGHPRSGDARAARTIARRLGWEATAYYEGDATDWRGWNDAIASTGTTGGFQWSGWAEAWLSLLARLGDRVMLGYLGDAVSGRHLAPAAGEGASWLDHWIAWSLEEGWADARVLRPDAARAMREATRARFEAMLAGRSFAFPHQRALHLDWYARQRRHVAAQANLIDRVAEPIPFFYTGAMLDFWANLPYEDLRGQSLYLRYARSRAPELWAPPKAPGLPERAAGFARNALARAIPAWRRALLPTEIDTGRIIAQNRAHLTGVVRAESDFVALVADPKRVADSIENYPDSTEMNSFQIMRLVNWLMVLRQGTARAKGEGIE